MLQIAASVGASEVHGSGLFAQNFVPKGTVIWRFDPNTAIKMSVEDFTASCLKLPFDEQVKWVQHSYLKDGVLFRVLDDSKFINHLPSKKNVALSNWKEEVALKDIHPGEELFEDYHDNYDQLDFFNMEFGTIDSDTIKRWIAQLTFQYP